MASENKDRILLRQHWQNTWKVCKMIHELDARWFLIAAAVAALDALIQYLVLLLSAWALTQSASHTDYQPLIRNLILFIIAILAGRVCVGILNREVATRQEALTARFQTMLSEKIMEMDFSVADSPALRKLRDRVRKDNNFGQGIYGFCWFVNNLFVSFFKIAWAVVIVMPVVKTVWQQRNLKAAGLFLLAILLTAFFSGLWMKEEKAYRKKGMNDMFDTPREMAQKSSLVWPFAEGTLFQWPNGKDVRIYDGEKLFEEYTFGRMERYEREKIKEYGKLFRNKERNFYFGQQLLVGVSYFIVTFVALSGTLESGALVKYAGALGNFFAGISMFITFCYHVAENSRRQLSSLELLKVPDEMEKGDMPIEKRSDSAYEIEFSHVWFRYPGSEEWALKDFSLKLKMGKKLAIVGMNGSGKTTMIKLLCRLYQPQKGEILLNSMDIRKFREEEYRKLFAVVFQDLTLFSLQLGENVAGAKEYDRKKAEKCLQDAGFGERLSRLDAGLDTFLYKDYEDTGVDVSGGEAQKIAIARALYKDAPFILLDEPTAALDPKAEYEIYSSFDKMVGNKTAIYISHRLSSCRFCDDIAVFDQGKLVQRGSHEELVKDEKGKYFELWSAQAQYYE